MKGRLHVLYPDWPREIHEFIGPIRNGFLSDLVGGLITYVPQFDNWIDEYGKAQQCLAACNEEAEPMHLPFNFPATAMWHYLLRAKGEKRQPVMLYGPVVIITGDDDFMESL